MNLDWLLDVDFSQWAGPGSVVIGGGFAVLIFLWGARTFRHRPSLPPPPEEALQPDPFVFGSARDKRRAARRKGSLVPVLIADAASKANPASGVVTDRSIGGVCLGVDNPASEGAILNIRPAHAPPLIPWTQVEVRSCRQLDDGWELGCQFLRPPPSTVLWMFG